MFKITLVGNEQIFVDNILITHNTPAYVNTLSNNILLLKKAGKLNVVEIPGSVNTETETQGKPGKDGKNGKNGKSAYEIAVEKGFSGTEQQWLDSLKAEGGCPAGGLLGQVLAKKSGNDGDVEWKTLLNNIVVSQDFPSEDTDEGTLWLKLSTPAN